MARIISASIDLNKISESKIKQHTNGARYYDFIITVNDEENDFGKDTVVSEGQTKEERDAKTKRKNLGYGKTIWKS